MKDLDYEIPHIESVPVVREFPKVFPNNILVIPPKREINFGINLIPDTNPIPIPPSLMAPPRLKKLKAQLNDLLNKGFIRPSICQ